MISLMNIKYLASVLFTGLVLAQHNSDLEQVKATYDRFEDKTTIELTTLWNVPVPQELRAYNLSYAAPNIMVAVRCDGRAEKCAVQNATISFEIYTKYVLYGRGVPGALLADGERIPLTLTWKPTRIATQEIAETMAASLSASQLKVLLVAKTIEGRIGQDEFVFSKANRDGLQRLKEKILLPE